MYEINLFSVSTDIDFMPLVSHFLMIEVLHLRINKLNMA